MTVMDHEDPALPTMPATFTVHTPSGPTHCCVAHARQIEGLMRMLGAHANFTKAPDDAQCANCENEAKARRTTSKLRRPQRRHGEGTSARPNAVGARYERRASRPYRRRGNDSMSWEVWGTPPDREPEAEPETGFMAPQIGPRQQWCCAKGCGPCTVKTVDYEWRKITSLRTGKVVQRDTYPLDVSSCCAADLMLWDEDKQDFVDFEMLDRPKPANGRNEREPTA